MDAKPVVLIPAKNGALRDPDTGRIVANPGGGTTAITPANASEYHQLYAQKRLEAELAAGRGLARVAVSGPSEFDAWADIAQNMAGVGVEPGPPKTPGNGGRARGW